MRRLLAKLLGPKLEPVAHRRPPPRADGLPPYVSGREYRAAIQQAYDAVLGPVGFARAGEMKWVRSRRPPIRDVVAVYMLKGWDYTTRWGVSLDFVPHLVDDSIRWHRTARSARIDLGYDPLDFIDYRTGAWNARPPTEDPAFEPLSLVDPAVARTAWWLISSWRPVEGVPSEQQQAARQILAMSTPWFEAIHDLSSLLDAFVREKQRPITRFGWNNYVQHRLAHAFTLAASGDTGRRSASLASGPSGSR